MYPPGDCLNACLSDVTRKKASAVKKQCSLPYGLFADNLRPDPEHCTQAKLQKWQGEVEEFVRDLRRSAEKFEVFTDTTFHQATSQVGYQLKPRALRLDVDFSKQVGIDDEAFVLANVELYYEGNNNTYWRGDSWYERCVGWTKCVAKARKDRKCTEIEEKAVEVSSCRVVNVESFNSRHLSRRV